MEIEESSINIKQDYSINNGLTDKEDDSYIENEPILTYIKSIKLEKVIFYFMIFIILCSITLFPETLNIENKAYGINMHDSYFNPVLMTKFGSLNREEKRKNKIFIDQCDDTCDRTNKTKFNECMYLCKSRQKIEFTIIFSGLFSILLLLVGYYIITTNRKIKENVIFLYNRITNNQLNITEEGKNLSKAANEEESLNDQSTINETRELVELLEGNFTSNRINKKEYILLE